MLFTVCFIVSIILVIVGVLVLAYITDKHYGSTSKDISVSSKKIIITCGVIAVALGITTLALATHYQDKAERKMKETAKVVLKTEKKKICELQKLDTGEYFHLDDKDYIVFDEKDGRRYFSEDEVEVIKNSDGNYIKEITTYVRYNSSKLSDMEKKWLIGQSISEVKVTYEIHVKE